MHINAANPDSRCWTVTLSGLSGSNYDHISRCTGIGRSTGKNTVTFKDRFCAACCHYGVMVPTTRVRVIRDPKGNKLLQNNRTACAWTIGHMSGFPPFRVVNHTFGSRGHQMVIFDSASSIAPFGTIKMDNVPETWLSSDGQFVHLCIAHGTLIPHHNLSAVRPPIHGQRTQASNIRLQDKLLRSYASPQHAPDASGTATNKAHISYNMTINDKVNENSSCQPTPHNHPGLHAPQEQPTPSTQQDMTNTQDYSDTELCTSDTESAAFNATTYNGMHQIPHAKISDAHDQHQSISKQMDPTESRLRGIAVSVLMDWSRNQSQ